MSAWGEEQEAVFALAEVRGLSTALAAALIKRNALELRECAAIDREIILNRAAYRISGELWERACGGSYGAPDYHARLAFARNAGMSHTVRAAVKRGLIFLELGDAINELSAPPATGEAQ